MTPLFSVAIVARNEAQNIARLRSELDDFVSHGGEVVLLDTGSDDDTPQLARDAGFTVHAVGARFHQVVTAEETARIQQTFAPENAQSLVESGATFFDFSSARNFAGTLARHDHILPLDAGDEMLAFDWRFLSRQIAQHPNARFFCRLAAGGAQLWIQRFYHRNHAIYRGRVHEVACWNDDFSPRDIYCDDTQLSLRHQYGEKKRSYLAGLALDCIEYSNEGRWKHYLAREMMGAGFTAEAQRLFLEHAQMTAWKTERSQSLVFAGQCSEVLGNCDDAASFYSRAILLDDTRREPFLRLAQLHLNLKNYRAAASYAEASLLIPRTNFYAENNANYTTLPHDVSYCAFKTTRAFSLKTCKIKAISSTR